MPPFRSLAAVLLSLPLLAIAGPASAPGAATRAYQTP